MPTARELLEQADALMRRNRAAETAIPTLTDAVTNLGPTSRESRNAAAARLENAVADEPPLLTDAVEEEAVDIPPLAPEHAQGEPSLWLGPDTIDPSLHSITGPAPDTLAVVPPVTLRTERLPEPVVFAEEPDPTATRTLRAAGSAPTPPPAGSAEQPAAAEVEGAASSRLPPAGDDHWRALAEQISMQVLQRIDLFTDTGLKAQLASHLQPIVARASAELVEAINDHVGELIRSYVAEAIEREIAQWRETNR
jgi:hypothetical protein